MSREMCNFIWISAKNEENKKHTIYMPIVVHLMEAVVYCTQVRNNKF